VNRILKKDRNQKPNPWLLDSGYPSSFKMGFDLWLYAFRFKFSI